MRMINILRGCTAAVTITAFAASAINAAPKAGAVLPAADRQLAENAWTELARAYPVAAASSDTSEALTPERLASWWDAFGDPIMTSLIKKSLEKNRDLAAARAGVTEARAALGVSQAALLPWLDTTNFWNSSRTPVDAGGTGGGGNLYRLGVDASWEIDVFGGRREKVKAQRATLEAQYAALYSTWTSLASEVAINYISLRTLQERLDIANYNLGLQNDTVEIQLSKTNSGLTDSLTLKQAQYTMEQTKAMIPNIEAALEQAKNALAILTGELPGLSLIHI